MCLPEQRRRQYRSYVVETRTRYAEIARGNQHYSSWHHRAKRFLFRYWRWRQFDGCCGSRRAHSTLVGPRWIPNDSPHRVLGNGFVLVSTTYGSVANRYSEDVHGWQVARRRLESMVAKFGTRPLRAGAIQLGTAIASES